jgi:hypothetical protein
MRLGLFHFRGILLSSLWIFYIVYENTCQVCDYIDDKGIWIAFIGFSGTIGDAFDSDHARNFQLRAL